MVKPLVPLTQGLVLPDISFDATKERARHCGSMVQPQVAGQKQNISSVVFRSGAKPFHNELLGWLEHSHFIHFFQDKHFVGMLGHLLETLSQVLLTATRCKESQCQRQDYAQ